MDIQNEILKRTFWLFHGIFDHYLKDAGKLEFQLSGGFNYGATRKRRNNVREKAISRYFAHMQRAISNLYK